MAENSEPESTKKPSEVPSEGTEVVGQPETAPPKAALEEGSAPKKTGGFDFLTVLLILVVALNVVFFVYNSYFSPSPGDDRPPAAPGSAPEDPGRPGPDGQASGPPSPSPRPSPIVLTEAEKAEVERISQSADKFRYDDPKLLMTLIAMANPESPVRPDAMQCRRFLSEFAVQRLNQPMEAVTASLLGEVLDGQRMQGWLNFGAPKMLPKGSPTPGESSDALLERTLASLNKILDDARPDEAPEVGKATPFKTLDEACKALLFCNEEPEGMPLMPSQAATALMILHPLVAAGTPAFNAEQKKWIGQNLRNDLVVETFLKKQGLPSDPEAALKQLQERARAALLDASRPD